MKINIFVIIFMCVCIVFNVSQIILYPCENIRNFIRIEKINNNDLWRMYINFAFYNLQCANLTIKFYSIVQVIAMYSYRASVFSSGPQFSGNIIRIVPNEGLKNTYVFDIKLFDNAAFPLVATIELNTAIICDSTFTFFKEVNYNNNNNIKGTTTPESRERTSTTETPMSSTTPTVTLRSTTTTEETIMSNATVQNSRCLQSCGRQKHVETVHLLYGGDEAESGQWPWHVAIYYSDSMYRNAKYRCGGSIISEKFILTVAHCVTRRGHSLEARRLGVLAGAIELKFNLADVKDCDDCQMIKGKEVVVHPHYISLTNTGDIALLKLEEDLDYTDYVAPICLATTDKTSLVSKYGTIVGFGLNEQNHFSENLKYTTVQIQSDTTCLSLDPLLYWKMIKDFTFCAGNGPDSEIGPCNGDSGGGLYISYTDKNSTKYWVLHGLVSISKAATDSRICDIHSYTIYTDVAAYNSWIVKNMDVDK